MSKRQKSVASLSRQIDACKRRIAAERDKLRDLTAEIADVLDSSDRALEALEEATEALSEYL